METKKAIERLRNAVHDISDEYTEDTCIDFLNAAIHEVALLLIGANSPLMVHETILHDKETLPERYIKSAGIYPVRITGNTVNLLLSETLEGLRFRYFATPALLDNTNGRLPFQHEAFNDYALKIATLFALNRNEFDISQDKALYDEFRTILSQAVA